MEEIIYLNRCENLNKDAKEIWKTNKHGICWISEPVVNDSKDIKGIQSIQNNDTF